MKVVGDTMSHHSEEGMLMASSDSFWEPGNYKRTTKRIEDGYKLCNDLITLVQERAEIEKAYARNLKTWSKKWAETIDKGPEYGTTEAAWKGVLIEADRLCDLHSGIRDELQNDVVNQIRGWQKDTYHKNVMNLKERKEMEDLFKKAQKPWAKILQKVNKAKADYHNACKNEKSALNQERNAASDSSLSPDQVKKLQDRVSKSKEEVQKTREKYDSAIQEITQYNPKYIEDMRDVFDKCQEVEAKRLKFFKDEMYSIHKCINISVKEELPQIYEEFYHTISNADHMKDLKWWSNNHGVNMAMNWPTFEDYSEEFRDITKSRVKDAVPAGGIMLLTQKPVSDDLPAGGPQDPPPPTMVMSKGNSIKVKANGNGTESKPKMNKGSPGSKEDIKPNGSGKGSKEGNPFEEEEWDEYSNTDAPLVDRGEPGIPVRALYDYDGAEDDELTFKQGEVFEKLEDEDEQGWCKGRKDGRVGLYPANYVEVVQ
ncbi:protein kinase C and casein kinase substrate in neurons protein 1 isoform X2 [Folsomia candida]|uniref:Protein kinase C and casein kinase substrate in neurons protein 2 n=1 Tax=Folsomia candida TaxID=158441 RepID=A0A226E808_FOLCA|nr:protein kinase C and casein kinase substrate in neurons protein 1 isoform X2 [Folsomia candida]OXA53001.1 Protein kinase C and casein kinase substrate in neurons protein 2 [Folsomia candida]